MIIFKKLHKMVKNLNTEGVYLSGKTGFLFFCHEGEKILFFHEGKKATLYTRLIRILAKMAKQSAIKQKRGGL
jgi:hypothetical protein